MRRNYILLSSYKNCLVIGTKYIEKYNTISYLLLREFCGYWTNCKIGNTRREMNSVRNHPVFEVPSGNTKEVNKLGHRYKQMSSAVLKQRK